MRIYNNVLLVVCLLTVSIEAEGGASVEEQSDIVETEQGDMVEEHGASTEAGQGNTRRNYATYRLTHNYKYVDSLTLRESKYYFISSKIKEWEHLVKLDVSNTHIRTFPPEMANCKKLKYFIAKNVGMKKGPSMLGKFTDLVIIDFRSNNITYIQNDAFENLQQLRLLYLEDNQLTTVPQTVWKCLNLEELYLARNQITELWREQSYKPPTVECAKCMKEDDMIDYYDFYEKHRGIYKRVDENGEEVRTVLKQPNQWRRAFWFARDGDFCHSLRILDLGGNRLSEFPKLLLHARVLEVLGLGGNKLCYLPKAFSVMGGTLRLVHCGGNPWNSRLPYSNDEVQVRDMWKEFERKYKLYGDDPNYHYTQFDIPGVWIGEGWWLK